MQSTLRTSFVLTLAIGALILAALADRLTTPRPHLEAQCFDWLEGLCQW